MKSTIHWALACTFLVAACSDQPFTVDVPFRVTSVTPSPGGQNIARRPEIVVTFSEDIDPASVTSDASFKVELVGDAGTTAVAGVYAYGQKGAAPYAASFRPNQPMPWGATVRLTLTTDVKRARDNAPLPTPISFEFHLETAPGLSVVSVTAVPADSPDAKIAVTFSEPVKCASLEAIAITETYDTALKTLRGTNRRVPGEWECDTQGPSDTFNCEEGACTYKFKATALTGNTAFDWSSKVTAAFNDADASLTVESARNNALAPLPNGGVFTVRMPDPPAFGFVSSTPASGAVGVAPGATLEFEFTARPRCSGDTLIGATVTATGSTGNVAGIWTCPTTPTADNTWVTTFKPTAPLALNARVTTKLAGGQWTEGASIVAATAATSVSGSLKTNVILDFTVFSPGGLAVESTSPVKSERAVELNAPIEVTFSRAISCSSLIVCDGTNEDTCSVTINETPDGGAVRPVAATVTCPTPSTAVFEPAGLGLSSKVSVTLNVLVRGADEGALVAPYTFDYDLVDPPAFSLVRAAPADGAAGVEQNPILKFTFSHQPVCTSAGLTGADVATGVSETNVPGVWDCTAPCVDDECLVTFEPTNELPLGATVKTTFQGGVVTTANATSRGGALPVTQTVTFRVLEPQPLFLVSSVPGLDATGVPQSASVTMNFSRAIACPLAICTNGSCPVSVSETKAAGGVGSADWMADTCSGSTLVIKPKPSKSPALSSNVKVTLKANAIQASDGGWFETGATFNWRVEDPKPLQVKSTKTTTSGTTTTVEFEFDRNVDCSAPKPTLQLAPAVAGTQGCTGNTKMTFSSTNFIHGQQYTATASANIKAVDATTVGGTTVYGELGQDVKYTFETAGPLVLVAASPSPGTVVVEQSIPITLTFNQNVHPSAIASCPGSGCKISVLANGDAIALATFSTSGRTISFTANANITNADYTISVDSGPNGVKSDGGKTLLADATSTFQVPGRATALLATETAGTNVALDAPVCVVFSDDVNIDSLEGNLTISPAVAFRADGKFLVSGSAGKSSNKACLNLGSKAGTAGDFRLTYATPYTLTAGTGIQFVSSRSLSTAKLLTFTTVSAPGVDVSAKYSNSVVTTAEPLTGTLVPFNAKLEISFDEPINPNTVNTATVEIRDAANNVVPVGIHATTTTVSLTSPDDDTLLEPLTVYTLKVVGGTGGVLLATNAPLSATKTFPFTTSAQTTFTDADSTVPLLTGETVTLTASPTPLHAASITSESAFGDCFGFVYEASLTGTEDIVFTPSAETTLPGDVCEFTITSDVLDALGNPVAGDTFVRNGP